MPKIEPITKRTPIIHKLKAGISVLLLLLAGRGQAQLVLNSPVTTGEFSAPTSIVLGPGFSASPGAGQSVHLFIAADCALLTTAFNQNQNWVVTNVPRISGITNASQLAGRSVCELMQTIQYYDGLGRPVQTVQVKGSANNKDVVQPMAYDEFGRKVIKYQPYAVTSGTSDGSYKSTAKADQLTFYNPAAPGAPGIAATPYPFAQTNLEASPLDRPLEQGAPGQAWQLSTSGISGSGHTISSAYGSNVANDIVLWNVNSSGDGAASSGFYAAGTLYATTVTDENAHAAIEYKDLNGKVICKKVQSGAGAYLSTNYIYDDYNNLAYVIPPLPASVNYPSSFTETDVVFINYIYGYHYDNRNRVIQKNTPGKGWQYIAYNSSDQPVLTQDANQRINNQWTVTKYDGQGRVIITGLWNAGSAINQATLQASIYAGSQWDSRDYTNTTTGYALNSYPALSTTLTVNYYDDYNIILNAPGYAAPAGASTMTKGLLTATRTAVLNTINNPAPDMLWAIHYYDNLGRVTQSYIQHYLGGSTDIKNYDVVNNTYDFTNAVTATTRQHYTSANTLTPVLTIANTYSYDHMGRKTSTSEQINSDTKVLLSQTDYNEIGQLKTKHLHSTNGGPFLQNIDYGYNERGWLKTSTAQLFAMQLNYNDGTHAQYNGNIADQYWGTPGSLTKSYIYQYDPLNRLTNGTSISTGFSETGITYDNMGNMLTLNRTGGANAALLSYDGYTGNQLTQVNNNGVPFRTYGAYDGNGNALSDGNGNAITYNLLNLPASIPGKSLTYTYDAAGNKLRKLSGSTTTEYIDGIQYNGTSIESVQTEEGRILNPTGTPNYEYTLTDHLGNSRVTFDSSHGGSTALQTDDYYPFGLVAYQPNTTSPENHYLYNKKELQEELGQYDYGARFYDPVIGRWTSMDPLAEKYQLLSPYAYVANNPLKFIDQDGREIILAVTNSKHEVTRTLTYRNGNAYWNDTGKKYDGTGANNTIYRVLKAYQTIENSKDDVLKGKLHTLEKSDLKHVVGEGDDNLSWNSGEEKGDRKGSNTTYNFSKGSHKEFKDKEGVDFSDLSAVTHEMSHQYDNDQGNTKDDQTGNSAQDPSEIRAVKTENRARKLEGAPARTTYNGEQINPKSLRN